MTVRVPSKSLQQFRGESQPKAPVVLWDRIAQGRRCELRTISAARRCRPTQRMAVALRVSAGALIFGKHERGPLEDLCLQFEAISQFDEQDKALARGLLEGLILKRHAKQSVARQVARNPPRPARKQPVRRRKARAGRSRSRDRNAGTSRKKQ